MSVRVARLRVGRRRFERLVLEALGTIPEPLRNRMDNVEVVVDDWPTPRQLSAADVDPDDLLFGLYEGTPLLDRGILSLPLLPDKITIFRGPLLEACASEAEIRDEVRKTVIHEVAHHFGLEEGRLAELGYD